MGSLSKTTTTTTIKKDDSRFRVFWTLTCRSVSPALTMISSKPLRHVQSERRNLSLSPSVSFDMSLSLCLSILFFYIFLLFFLSLYIYTYKHIWDVSVSVKELCVWVIYIICHGWCEKEHPLLMAVQWYHFRIQSRPETQVTLMCHCGQSVLLVVPQLYISSHRAVAAIKHHFAYSH